MTLFDFINASFELGSAFVQLGNCMVLYRAKRLAGYSIWATVFFTTWGLWNMIWYPSLHAWASFAGGIGIVFANLLWIALAVHYGRHDKLASVASGHASRGSQDAHLTATPPKPARDEVRLVPGCHYQPVKQATAPAYCERCRSYRDCCPACD